MAQRDKEGMRVDPLGWMFTFSDLVTLLLTFFVMLLTMKEPEAPKIQEAFGLFASGGGSAVVKVEKGQPKDIKVPGAIHQPSVDELLKIDTKISLKMGLPPVAKAKLAQKLQNKVSFRRDPRGEVITLTNDLLFEPAGAKLTEKAKEALGYLADVLRQVDVPMVVEGHTDNVKPGSKTGWEDNWSLSLARALSVIEYLVKKQRIPADLLRVGALGSSRPLVANDTIDHRAMNRRTEIVLLTNES